MMFLGHQALQGFDIRIFKFQNPPAFETDQMVMMFSLRY